MGIDLNVDFSAVLDSSSASEEPIQVEPNVRRNPRREAWGKQRQCILSPFQHDGDHAK